MPEKIKKCMTINAKTNALIKEISQKLFVNENKLIEEMVRNCAIDLQLIAGEKNANLSAICQTKQQDEQMLKLLVTLTKEDNETLYLLRDAISNLLFFLRPELEREFRSTDVKTNINNRTNLHEYFLRSSICLAERKKIEQIDNRTDI